MTCSKEGCDLPAASLHLLVPPVRIMSAFIWQVVQKNNVDQYDKVLDFISLVTQIVPEILNPSQKAQLILSLRVKIVLGLCRSDGFSNLKLIQNHLDEICTWSVKLTSHQMESVLMNSFDNFASMVHNIVKSPLEKELFFQEVFPEKYGSSYDERVQQLVSLLLSRLEELLPIPDIQQTTAWLSETFTSDEFSHRMSHPETLKTLLLHHRELGTLSSALSVNEEDTITSTLNPPLDIRGKLGELHSDNEEFKAALSLVRCPHCSFTHCLRQKLQEHIQTEHINVQKKIRPVGQKLYSIKEKKDDKEKNLEQQKEKDGKKQQEKEEENQGEKNYLCTTCGKSFLSPQELLLHTWSHMGELPYTCQQCGKGFSSKGHRNVHMRSHTGERPYLCSECPKRFLTATCLKRHMFSHTGVKPFRCLDCGKDFSQKGNLKRHMVVHKRDS